MIKSSILDLKAYHTSIKKSVKSKWCLLLILFPLVLYLVYLLLEVEILTAAVSYLPIEGDKSIAFYMDLFNLIFMEYVWLSAFLALTWIFVVYVPLLRGVERVESHLLTKPGATAAIIIGISFLVSVVVAYYTLALFPNSSDEYVYLYQAKMLSEGKLWENTHDLPDFFFFNNIVHKEGISVGRFPPGWPLVLSAAYLTGLPPFLVNPLLGLVALIVFYAFAKKFYGVRIAIWSLLALALTSFYIFNAASFFSHASCLLFTLGLVYLLYRYEEKSSIHYALLAGLLLSLVMITRYYTAILIFIPFVIYFAYKQKIRSLRLFFWIAIGTLPCMIFLLWYNYSITGNALLPVTVWGYHDEGLGFVRGHTPVQGVYHIIRRMLMFLYWCSPALLLLYFIYLVRKVAAKSERFIHPEDYVFVLLIIGYFFYYEIGGNQYGPRFLFEALPFLIVFVVSRVFQHREKWAMALLCAGLIFAAVKLPFIAQREHRIVLERTDVYRVAEKNNLHDAVVFVSSFTGVMRPMPVGDLTRNDVHYQNEVIYAKDIGETNQLLMDYYPERRFYRYVRDKESVEGKLIRIR